MEKEIYQELITLIDDGKWVYSKFDLESEFKSYQKKNWKKGYMLFMVVCLLFAVLKCIVLSQQLQSINVSLLLEALVDCALFASILAASFRQSRQESKRFDQHIRNYQIRMSRHL